MEFFKKLGGWKKGLENTAKAGAVVAALGGATFTDGTTNQVEAQTILKSVETPSKLDFIGNGISQEYKYNFEKWVKEVVNNPKVIPELLAMSKKPIESDGTFSDILDVEYKTKSQILFSEGNGLPANLINKELGIEKIYMTITRSSNTLKGPEVIVFFTTREMKNDVNEEPYKMNVAGIYNPITKQFRRGQ